MPVVEISRLADPCLPANISDRNSLIVKPIEELTPWRIEELTPLIGLRFRWVGAPLRLSAEGRSGAFREADSCRPGW